MSKNALIGPVFGVLLIVVATIFLLPELSQDEPEPTPEPLAEEPAPEPFASEKVIGQSVEGRDIVAATFGRGDTRLLFVGGMHGGYEWNSVLLAYEMIDYLTENPEMVPADITIDIIPDLNPDGTFSVVGKAGRFSFEDIPNPAERVAAGRFNANGVDLNRNFDCNWAPESTWRGEVVSAGTAPFSEPEAQALRSFVAKTAPDAAIFWHSKANNVYASECNNGVLPETLDIMTAYADAGSYGAVPVFDAYPITGDAEGWLASLGIPAITVELESPSSLEWSRNLAGTKAVIDYYSVAK